MRNSTRAQSKLDFATAGRARAERLFAQNAIAREEYEQLTSAATEAAADVGSIRAQLDTAHLNLEFTQVRSPIDGHVSRALITAGNLVSSADVLTTWCRTIRSMPISIPMRPPT